MNYRAPTWTITSLIRHKIYQKPPGKSLNELDVYKYCKEWYVTCVTCHTCATCHRLLGYSEVCTTELPPPIFSLSRCSYSPNQTTAGAITKGSVLSRWVLSVTAPVYHSTCSKTLQWTSHSLPEPSAAAAPLAHGPNIKITQKQHIKSRDTVRSEGREQWSIGDDPPLFWAAPAKAVAEEQQWLRSSTAAVPSARWSIPGRRHNQIHKPGSQKMGLH